MHFIPRFGEGVHAVLPFLKENPKYIRQPYRLNRDFERVLGFYNAEVRFKDRIPDALVAEWSQEAAMKARILDAWKYVAETIRDYDEAVIEPRLPELEPGGAYYRPDLFLRRGKTFLVVDVKTTAAYAFPWPAPSQRLINQVSFGAEVLRRQLGNDYPIEGRGIIINSDPTVSFEPQWLDVPIEAYERLSLPA